MSIKAQEIEIRRSELHTVVETLAVWEVPVVAAIHEGGIKVLRDTIIANVESPDPKEEYERLENRYKRSRNDDGSFGLPVVADVYGQHMAGIQALGRAIDAARISEDSLV